MPNISMLDIEDLKKIKLAPFIDKCLKHRVPALAFHAMQGHNPDLSQAMYIAWGTVFNTGKVDHNLKKIIRVQICPRPIGIIPTRFIPLAGCGRR